MDFTLDKKHLMARQLFKDFAEKEVKPLAQEIDETERFPRLRSLQSSAALQPSSFPHTARSAQIRF